MAHPARLFAVIVGKSARSRKGTSRALIQPIIEGADPLWANRVVSGFGSGEAIVDAVRDATEDEAAASDRRLLVFEAEFSRILKVATRDGSTLSPIVRDAWDGNRLQVRTRQRTVQATGANISVLAHITSEELRRDLTATEIANGFANRFLFVVTKRSKKLPAGGNLDDELVDGWARKLQELVLSARKTGRLHRTPDADARWTEFYNGLPDDVTGMYGSVTARAEAQVLRLAVAYALLDGSHSIEIEHLRAGEALWSYCDRSAGYLFQSATGDPIGDRVVEELENSGGGPIRRTEISALFGRHVKAAEIDLALDRLEEDGYIDTVEGPSTGGRPPRLIQLAKKANQAK